MILKIKKIISLITLFSIFILFSGCIKPPKVTDKYKMTLEIWGLFDDSVIYDQIFNNYKNLNSQVDKINYKKLSPDTYKKEIIEALAANQGPDIVLINNAWIPQFKNIIAPAPKNEKNINNIVVNEQKLKKDFVDVVADDFIIKNEIYGLPLSVDSLGLYYNRYLFNEMGIALPPKNWDEFSNFARLLTKKDVQNRIVQAGAAMGTAYNINRSSDILALLMMQKGAQMNKSDGSASFKDYVKKDRQNYYPGESALNFYNQFSSISSGFYSWNSLLHYSIDAFSEGTCAMMLNYSWQLETIKAKSPKLNFAVAPIPQFNDGVKINFANYWAYTVIKQHAIEEEDLTNEERIYEAWKLLTYLATNPENNIYAYQTNLIRGAQVDKSFDPGKVYLEATKKPATSRDIIESQKNDADLGVFAEGNLMAKSWYQNNSDDVEAIFAEMIDNVNRGRYQPKEAVDTAQNRINKLK